MPPDEDIVIFEPRLLTRLRHRRYGSIVGWMLLIVFRMGTAAGAGVTLEVRGSATSQANRVAGDVTAARPGRSATVYVGVLSFRTHPAGADAGDRYDRVPTPIIDDWGNDLQPLNRDRTSRIASRTHACLALRTRLWRGLLRVRYGVDRGWSEVAGLNHRSTVRSIELGVSKGSRSMVQASWVAGSGVLETQSRDVHDFSIVCLAGTGDLVVRQTGTESLSVTADDNLLPHLTSRVEGDTLTLSTEPGINFQPSKEIRYVVTVKRLSGIALAGSGAISAGDFDSPELRVTLSGSGTISVAGVAGNQAVVLSGSGNYLARDLRSRSVNVTISGSADATVAASESLDVTVTGMGTVWYAGDPTVRKTILGLGRVARAV